MFYGRVKALPFLLRRCYGYIRTEDAIIDKDEFQETRDHIEYIKRDAQKYIDDYVNTLLGKSMKYDKKEFERIYQYSTLQYFHKELGVIV